MPLSRRTLLTGLIASPAVTLVPALPAFAASPQVFQVDKIAIRGADPVAYFTDEKPVAGSPDHAYDWNGATWHFANADNLMTFKDDPEKYAPVFGGYCAYAASKGYLAPTIPEAWTVYEDRLYLNANLRARELWLQDVPGNIAKGHGNWPGILG